MKKKKDEFYYKNLNQCAGYACRAAEVLQETLKEFDQTALQERWNRYMSWNNRVIPNGIR